MTPTRLIAPLLVLLLAACAAQPTPTPTPVAGDWTLGDAGELNPIVVSSEIAVGENRLLFRLVDSEHESVAAPERPVTVNVYDLADVTTPVSTVEAAYLATLPNLPGLYRAQVVFDRAGDWGLEVVANEPDGSTRSGRMALSVREQGSTPPIGATAPSTDTPTATSAAEIAALSTDPAPDPDFYTTSAADALAAGQPFLLIFATPAFCKTATCGPALEIVKSVAPEFKGEVTFIHVEPYELEERDGSLQPVVSEGQLVPIEAVVGWGILTEPYIFVVDRAGLVAAKLEGVASAEEIRQALEAVAR